MATENYHVFGLGFGRDDLRYIGWTQRSVDEESEQIVSDVLSNGGAGMAGDRARIDIFEIESVPSLEEAATSATCLCGYFNSLGLYVKCGC